MRLPDRKETEVRAMLESGTPGPVPTDLAERAMLLGLRTAHRRRTAQWLLWIFFAAAVAFAVWAAVTEPWLGPPQQTTPPLGW